MLDHLDYVSRDNMIHSQICFQTGIDYIITCSLFWVRLQQNNYYLYREFAAFKIVQLNQLGIFNYIEDINTTFPTHSGFIVQVLRFKTLSSRYDLIIGFCIPNTDKKELQVTPWFQLLQSNILGNLSFRLTLALCASKNNFKLAISS